MNYPPVSLLDGGINYSVRETNRKSGHVLVSINHSARVTFKAQATL